MDTSSSACLVPSQDTELCVSRFQHLSHHPGTLGLVVCLRAPHCEQHRRIVVSLRQEQRDKIEDARKAERFSINLLLDGEQVATLVDVEAREHYIGVLEEQLDPHHTLQRDPSDVRGTLYMDAMREVIGTGLHEELKQVTIANEQGNTEDRKDKTTRSPLVPVRLSTR